MRLVSSISLKTSIAPPFYGKEPSSHSADYSKMRGYDVYESADGQSFYVVKSPKDGVDQAENGVIRVPASHVIRCEYVSLAESPIAKLYGLKADEETAEQAEVKRGPGRPRKDSYPLA